jgi:molybdate transport system regulatory protein
MKQTRHRLKSRLEVETEVGVFLGDRRIRLLEAIDQHGSINGAAPFVPISYKAAWDAVDTMNNLADEPLVTRAVGGKNGGGTRLTNYGRSIVALYRALETEYQTALDRLAASMNEGEANNLAQFRQLLRRMSMRTSARNQLAGVIVALHTGEVNYEVRLKLDETTELAVVITRESAETLGLSIGMEAYALVKSASVLLMTDKDARTTARNHLWGEVSHIHAGLVSTEVVITLPGGKNLCAVVTSESAIRLDLVPGMSVCAVIDASSVILCIPE